MAALAALLDDLDVLRAKAKPGPWRLSGNGEDVVSPTHGVVADAYENADAALIVAAVNALPELVAKLRAVEALADRYDEIGTPTLANDIRITLAAAVTTEADR